MTTPRVLVLTSSLLTDRMLRHSAALTRLAERCEVVVWSTGVTEPEELGASGSITFSPFPELVEFKHPVERLRLFNDALWDHRLQLPSRRDQWSEGGGRIRGARRIDRLVPLLDVGPVPSWFERVVGRAMVRSMSSSTVGAELARLAPDLVVSMCPMWSLEAAVSAAAMSQGIGVVAFMTSFDNLSTKRRVELPFERWLLWSPEQRDQLHEYYPTFRLDRIDLVGAPQFDVFFDDDVREDRATWCASVGLDPTRPIVVIALGSPNFFEEEPAAHDLAERFGRGDFGDAQLVVRPHPIHDDRRLAARFVRHRSEVVVQATGPRGSSPRERSQSRAAIAEWVNTFRHADVVVNLSSSVTVDAAVLDTPVVSMDFDPSGAQDWLVGRINRVWRHFAPIARSGGVVMAGDMDEVAGAVKTYLADPSLHRDERRWIAEFVIGEVDGRNGERFADAVLAAIGSRLEV